MKVFIVGASGLVGSNCMALFTQKGWEVKGSYFSYPTESTVFYNTLEATDPTNFDIAAWQPDAIVHCGALTHVDYCENNIEESYNKTVQSTINVIELAHRCKAKMVYLSTDYVFDGKDGPYTETAPVKPLSIYGEHKLLAEQKVLAEIKNALVLRVTNIFGQEERGKNFVSRIVQQCKNKQKLTLKLPFDQFASPTNAIDIAGAMHLLLRDGKSGIYHIGGTDYMNRVALALRVLSYFPNAEYDLIPISTSELLQPAARPLLGGFVTAKFSKEYPEYLFSNVDDFLKKEIQKEA